jgi:hypothetical protein
MEEQTNARIRSLKAEVQQLQNDILLLRDLAPVLYLGGNEKVDFVLDLKQVAREKSESKGTASFEETDGPEKGVVQRW